jgi:hypothetical protein
MHDTHIEGGTSVLTNLRSLIPNRRLTLDEGLNLAERQAIRLLELCGGPVIPVPISIITDQARVRVEHDPELPSHAASGCSDWDARRRSWVISLNPTEPRRRRRFTVLHEYKHIIDHGSPRILPAGYAYQRPAAEIIADYFAGCVLMPKRQLAAAYYDGIQRPTDLAQLFDVSKEAIQVRLAQVGLDESANDAPGRAGSPYPARASRYYRTAQIASHPSEVAA